MKEKRYLTVAALTKYIKRKFDADPHLQGVHVKGEISNFKQHSSGHMYFTLKDDKARILAVMFSSDARAMKFIPENGMKVLITGNITVYEQSGQYQIYVKNMQPDGIGELYLAYEQLKEKLEKEGLFSPAHKKPLPKYPKTIGVITSPTGAAVRDIITTIKRRYPVASILIFPAIVQGDQAPNSIVNAIKTANEMDEVDCLIVGRGGGSIEELWAFNEEIVVRAIYTSTLPIISAVGHETDFTIADFVADMRAPTPTGAAELAVPHVDELMERILTRQTRMLRVMKERVHYAQERLKRIERSYAFRYPRRAYEQKMEQVDRATERLVKGAEKQFLTQKEAYLNLNRRIERHKPRELLKEAREQHEKAEKQMNRVMTAILADKQKDFRQMLTTLEALSPLKVMERGYSLVYDDSGKLVKSVNDFSKEDQLTVRMSDGSIQCQVLNVEGKES
ncbi:exodeoxyribonuclease 7 large subunit [Robertmurraya siralis]|uniref:Exodeoxyribonuclease 7 large subunit n=1 Tax=Robertmurraya siralis TaxID=77777 RepID=A0A920BS12_9BACI|nr:exodeoxyribonuclease VII large subunit [Robertmurraya siralis]PAE22125.1 exodeoxyribonuclease VII large subunit [Bacillus sp. 7504-2]GIN60590.1 exodeoxyribonuclease 7 large subunit [Robertmurraya siralis]